ncbi:hypothetical protein ACVFYP_19645 [Roseomonas sp. F4]
MSESAETFVAVQIATELPIAADPLALAVYGSNPGTGAVEQTPVRAIRDASVTAAEIAAIPVAEDRGAAAGAAAAQPYTAEAADWAQLTASSVANAAQPHITWAALQSWSAAAAENALAVLTDIDPAAPLQERGYYRVRGGAPHYEGPTIPTLDQRQAAGRADAAAVRQAGAGLYALPGPTAGGIYPVVVDDNGRITLGIHGATGRIIGDPQALRDLMAVLASLAGAMMSLPGAQGGILPICTDDRGNVVLGYDIAARAITGAFPDVQTTRQFSQLAGAADAQALRGGALWTVPRGGGVFPFASDDNGRVLLGYDPAADALVGAWPGTGGVSTRDLSPIYGSQLFGVSGQVLPLYIANLAVDRGDGGEAICTISSQPDFPAAPLVVTGTEQLAIPVDRLGASAELVIRRRGSMARQRIALSVSKRQVPIVGTSSPRILILGDSISNRAGAAHIDQHLTAWGFTPQWLGTIRGTGFDQADTLNEDGPLGECREGWAAYGDYLYAVPEEADVNRVIAAGQEATYLGLSKTSRRRSQIFIRPAESGDDPSTIYNGYVFDFGFYLSRFAIPTPDIVIINLWVNDVTEAGAAGAGQVYIGLSRMIDSIRQAAPLANILLWYSAIPRSADADTAWTEAYRAGQQAVVRVVRHRRVTDPRVHLVSAGAHMSQEAGWTSSYGTANADTGIQSATITDYRHPVTLSRRQQFEAVAAAVACLAP